MRKDARVLTEVEKMTSPTSVNWSACKIAKAKFSIDSHSTIRPVHLLLRGGLAATRSMREKVAHSHTPMIYTAGISPVHEGASLGRSGRCRRKAIRKRL